MNVPLADNIAIRLVAWDEHDAGYIDNVAGTNVAGGIVDGVRDYFCPPSCGLSQNNAAERKNDENNVDIYGGRAQLKIDLDNNWTITPSLMGQDTKAYGSFAFDPAVGDLKVVKFAPEFSNDRWYQAGLTIEGKIANLDVTYAGAYMDRKVNSQLDYSDYSYFYDQYYGQYFTDNNGNLIDPAQKVIGRDHFTRTARKCASPRRATIACALSPDCSTSGRHTESSRTMRSTISIPSCRSPAGPAPSIWPTRTV